MADQVQEAQVEQEFNQEAIDYFVSDLREQCRSKGDAHAKKVLAEFGKEAKKVVADNTKNMTLSFEKEKEMLVHLKLKNTQMQNGLAAIETRQNQFKQQIASLLQEIENIGQQIQQEMKKHEEKSTLSRKTRGDLKVLTLKLEKDRVAKFGSLIKTKEDKYSCLTQLARLILRLLGTEVDANAHPDTKLFGDMEQLKLQMNTRDPMAVSSETATQVEQVLNDLKDKYTKKGSPKEFKKVYKYDSLHNWASKFVEVVHAAHAAQESSNAADELKIKEMESKIRIDNLQVCLNDLQIFDV